MPKNTLLFVLLILIGGIVYYFFQSGLIKIYDPCEESREIYEMTFDGIIIEKKDTRLHHASRCLLVDNDAEASQMELDLLGDNNINKSTGKSNFWESVHEGDSVSKRKGTFTVSYKNANSD